MSLTIDWEYRTEDAARIMRLRDHLHRRFKEGWKLYLIEGKVLHFRRRSPTSQI